MKKTIITNVDEIRQSLRERIPELQSRYGVKSLGLFGSYWVDDELDKEKIKMKKI